MNLYPIYSFSWFNRPFWHLNSCMIVRSLTGHEHPNSCDLLLNPFKTLVLIPGEMIEKLTLSYNRTRQAVITGELIEIISGAAAL